MKSYFEQLLDHIRTDIEAGFSLVTYDRQLLVYIILTLMLDTGIYDLKIPKDNLDAMIDHGIKYSFNYETGNLEISTVFPEESKRIESDG